MRRRVLGGQKNMALIHNWDVDNYTSGDWVDSVGGVILTKVGSPSKVTQEGVDVMKVNYSNYFVFDMNNTTNGFRFGDVFKVEVECIEYSITDNKDNAILDFGSLTQANHSFGILSEPPSSTIAPNGWFFCTKLFDNAIATIYSPSISNETSFGVLKKITFGIERSDSTNNICYSQLNDGEKIYGSTSFLRNYGIFNRNFETCYFYVGRGHANNNYQSTDYKYIKSIKIYKLIESESVPYDAEISYLQSDGGQIIDTGINGGSNVGYDINYEFLSTFTNWEHLCGSGQPPVAPKVYRSSNSGYGLTMEYNGSNQLKNMTAYTDTSRCYVHYYGGYFWWEKFSTATTKGKSTGYLGFGTDTFNLFGHLSEPDIYGHVKIYYAKVWKDGDLVRDMIPVRVGQVGYMYDRISGQLFGNIGSGSFTLGADVRDYPYVEIGGIKWAKINIGAETETDYGLYFQWGDTQGYTASQVGSGSGQKAFTWSDYKYGGNDNGGQTKYNNSLKTILDTSDDAATAIWGDGWRMPTKDEFIALGNAVTTQWIVNYKGSGVNGMLLRDKTDNNKALFFPACGFCDTDRVLNVGSNCFYWSRTLNSSDVSKAYSNNLSNSAVYWQPSYGRFVGFSIRPVMD